MVVADEKMQRKLFRWWRQGKPLGFVYDASADDRSVVLQFSEIDLTLTLEKASSEAPEEAVRRYFAEFQNWKAVEDEWITIDEADLAHAWSQVVSELEWMARAITALVKSRPDLPDEAAAAEPDDSSAA